MDPRLRDSITSLKPHRSWCSIFTKISGIFKKKTSFNLWK